MIPTFKNEEEADRYYEGKDNDEKLDSGLIVPEDEEEAAIIELEGERYEVIDTVEFEGKNYIALLPYSEEEADDEDLSFTILEIIDDGDEKECTLRTVDDEELYTRIGDEFLRIFGEYDEESEE